MDLIVTLRLVTTTLTPPLITGITLIIDGGLGLVSGPYLQSQKLLWM